MPERIELPNVEQQRIQKAGNLEKQHKRFTSYYGTDHDHQVNSGCYKAGEELKNIH